MTDIDWALTARVIIWTVLAFFAVGVLEFLAWGLYAEIRKLFAALKTRREFRGHLESERRRVRLEKLLELADEYEAAETEASRSLTFRKATDLGFTDGPFMLDENEQPHKPAA